jgi:sirohydrochlorin ferrochelatase
MRAGKKRLARPIRWIAILTAWMVMLVRPPLTAGEEQGMGILLLAHGAHGAHDHGGGNPWNDNVERLAREVDQQYPTEVAFGMADPASIQAAVDRLDERGIRDIAVVPLFVSSHSPIIGNFKYILGLQPGLAKTTSLTHLDRIHSTARFRFAEAMDAHPLISQILLERALAATTDPARTHVVLIAHGPNDEAENRLWLRDMEAHGRFLRERGGFAGVSTLTHRNDASARIRAEARADFRRQVEEAGRKGTVVVVPLLLSKGGIEQSVQADLDGLAYRFTEPLMPHPTIARWVEATAASLFTEAAVPAAE